VVVVTINPITRLEGHGKISIFLDEKGDVKRAFLQIPELRGFEKIAVGRHSEDMPQITSRICGVCPWAHHMAATKALDDLYKVKPPSAAVKIRKLAYNLFMLEDHSLHFFVLAGPDFVVGPKAPRAERNIIGIIKKLGAETVKKIVLTRKRLREADAIIGGKTIHPVSGLPGGVSKPLTEDDRKELMKAADAALELADTAYKLLKDLLKNEEYVKLITSDIYAHETYYMGLVDDKNRIDFYDGKIRVVDPKGREHAKFDVHDYLKYIAEHVEPWTYARMSYLKTVGWKGLVDGEDSGLLAVGPLGRLNAAEGMATPRAQAAYEEMYGALGGKPTHYTLAYHIARVVEMIQAAEHIKELVEDPEITSLDVRNLPTSTPDVGIGVVEAPRGTLIHHYEADEKGVIKKANLIVATQNNVARMCLSVEKAAKMLIKGGVVDDGLLNMVEMAFRAYDPCFACATHSIIGRVPLKIEICDHEGRIIKVITNVD
jgi:F420-non-reducing hydrogenase large subunit